MKSLLREYLAKRYRRARWITRRAGTQLRRGDGLSALPVVFANAIPKSGSNLLFNVIRGLVNLGPFVDSAQPVIKPYTNGKPTSMEWTRKQLDLLRPGDIRCGYLYATPENMAALLQPNWALFLITRDPRDNIVSEIFYALDIYPDHALHDHLLSMSSMEERIDTLIHGIPEGDLKRAGVAEHYDRFLPWHEQAQVCTVRFEELISHPQAQLGRILDHLENFRFTPAIARTEAIDTLGRKMDPKRSNTYREGKSGAWRKHFTDRNRHHFKEHAGDLLIELGYETDLDW